MRMKKLTQEIKSFLIIQLQLMEINLKEVKVKVFKLELGKDLFLKGFDQQLNWSKKR